MSNSFEMVYSSFGWLTTCSFAMLPHLKRPSFVWGPRLKRWWIQIYVCFNWWNTVQWHKGYNGQVPRLRLLLSDYKTNGKREFVLTALIIYCRVLFPECSYAILSSMTVLLTSVKFSCNFTFRSECAKVWNNRNCVWKFLSLNFVVNCR